MSFMSMDLLFLYLETENENQYALSVICMLTKYALMIPIKSKAKEEVIKAYLKHVHFVFRGTSTF